jgi:hypothetical protein
MTTLTVNGGSSGGNNSDQDLDETPVDPDITECPNPKECTIPGAQPSSWLDKLPGSTPVNSNIADSRSSLLSSRLDQPEAKTSGNPDVVECPNPKECTIPTARASSAR